MRLFAPSLAFVDLETTGMRAARDRITEIGIVRVDAAPGEDVPRITEWSSLVNPGTGIPAKDYVSEWPMDQPHLRFGESHHAGAG